MTSIPSLPPYDSGRYHRVVPHEGPYTVLDLRGPYDPEAIERAGWCIGRYDERRTTDMYSSHIYIGGRTIHVGLDLWGPAGTPVFAFAEGRIYAVADNGNPRDYGPTVVTEHLVEGVRFWALYGHLSRDSLTRHDVGDDIAAGDVLGHFGDESVNGGWAPHLHLQLSVVPPHGADLPGVVHPRDRERALELYPDPRMVVGPIY